MSRSVKLPPEFQDYDFMSLYRKEAKGYSKVRLLAMHHMQRGLQPSEVSKIVGYPRQTIWEWLQWFKSGGISRLQSSPHNRGRKSKLTAEQEELLKDEIIKLQELRTGGRVNGADITEHIKNLWGIQYAPGSIYTLLSRLKLVWITGRSRHPKSDPQAQEAFKK